MHHKTFPKLPLIIKIYGKGLNRKNLLKNEQIILNIIQSKYVIKSIGSGFINSYRFAVMEEPEGKQLSEVLKTKLNPFQKNSDIVLTFFKNGFGSYGYSQSWLRSC